MDKKTEEKIAELLKPYFRELIKRERDRRNENDGSKPKTKNPVAFTESTHQVLRAMYEWLVDRQSGPKAMYSPDKPERTDILSRLYPDLSQDIDLDAEFDGNHGHILEAILDLYPDFILDQYKDSAKLDKEGDASNGKAILQALYLCFSTGTEIPTWCKDAFIKKYEKAEDYEFKSWDNAFGRPKPKNARIAPVDSGDRKGKAEEMDISFYVYLRVRQLIEEGEPLKAAWAKAGREYNISKGRAKNYYYLYHKPASKEQN